MYYAASTGGFYSAEIHGRNIPADAVEIDDAQHAALLAGQAAGRRIAADNEGRPVLADPLPPTSEDLRAEARAYLASTDWYVLRQMETGEPIPADVAQHRAQARTAASS